MTEKNPKTSISLSNRTKLYSKMRNFQILIVSVFAIIFAIFVSTSSARPACIECFAPPFCGECPSGYECVVTKQPSCNTCGEAQCAPSGGWQIS
ncbi:hypothetical protein G9A89_001813 [Geosiphon pyriformis]|nr:hypothetical protein G9A89_001813 [Geosiphon pyriformis]